MKFKIPIQIAGIEWEIYYCSSKTMLKVSNDKCALGMCDPSTNIIYINRQYNQNEKQLKETITHEIFHAYIDSCNLSSTNETTLADLEEICAEMVSRRLDELVIQTDYILQAIKGIK
jgi:hypothetical protein